MTLEPLYTLLIVDDEAPARALLEQYCASFPEVRVGASCANVMAAQAYVAREHVDIILCDIQMPRVTGIDFIRNLEQTPAVIFTTAYSQFAAEGFDLDATDYLLKPIAFPRFERAMNKAMAHVRNRREHDTSRVLFVKADHRTYRIALDDLLYVEAQHEYVMFHCLQASKVLAYGSLKGVEKQLNTRGFLRIHKSYLVAVDKLERIDSATVQVGGVTLPVGRAFRDNLKAAIR